MWVHNSAADIVEVNIMDLTTLVTACIPTVDRTVVHALVWHQSAANHGHCRSPTDCIRKFFGIGKMPSRPRATSQAMSPFASAWPAYEVRLNPSQQRCLHRAPTSLRPRARSLISLMPARAPLARKATRFTVPLRHTMARGEHPDSRFADSVRTSIANDDTPDFEMPAGT
jgi:hypothetical protein